MQFLLELQTIRPPKHLVQLSISKGGLGILDINQLNSFKSKLIQRLLNPASAFLEYLMLYSLDLIFNSNLSHV